MVDGQDLLASALNALATLASGPDQERITGLLDRLAAARLRIVVTGEATRGKSTLINALLGSAVLPAGVTPLTRVVTTVRYGGDPHAQVQFADGHTERHPLTALPGFVTEKENPANTRGVARVTVYADAAVLASGAELVDTPGTGPALGSAAAGVAGDALADADMVLLVLAADLPLSAGEWELLDRVMRLPVTTFTVLNRADHLDGASLAEVAGFVRRVLAGQAGAATEAGQHRNSRSAGSGQQGGLYLLSARAALGGGDPGFAAFAGDLTACLAAQGAAQLRRSAAAQARQLAARLLDQVVAARQAARTSAAAVASGTEQFQAALAAARIGSHDAASLINGESVRLLYALNDAADADQPRILLEVAGRLGDFLDGELRTATPAQIERQGLDHLASLAEDAVRRWHRRQRTAIERGLASLDARLTAGLDGELSALCRRAELASLNLPEPAPVQPAPGHAWPDLASGDAGQRGQRPPTASHGIPGEPGRRRARQHVRDAAAGLTASHLNRASADLRDQLAHAARALDRAAGRRRAAAAQWAQAAMQAVAELQDAAAAGARHKDQELACREQALRHVLSLITETTGREGSAQAQLGGP